MKKISLIVTDASPLITLAIAGSLDVLLLPEIRVVIPDMVKFEVTRHSDMPGAQEVLDWIRENDMERVFVGNTEVFEEFVILHEHNPKIKSKGRGERAAGEILSRELAHGIEAAVLLFEDGDVRKDNFLLQLPDNIVVISTSEFLNGLKDIDLLDNVDAILDKAIAIRGEKILERIIKVTDGLQGHEDDWADGLKAR